MWNITLSLSLTYKHVDCSSKTIEMFFMNTQAPTYCLDIPPDCVTIVPVVFGVPYINFPLEARLLLQATTITMITHSEIRMTPPTAPPTDHPMTVLSSYEKKNEI